MKLKTECFLGQSLTTGPCCWLDLQGAFQAPYRELRAVLRAWTLSDSHSAVVFVVIHGPLTVALQ